MKAAAILAISFLWQAGALTNPFVSENVSPLEVVSAKGQDGQEAVAVVRKPPGKGPFPAVVILHGGLNSQPISRLKESALNEPTHVRFWAAGYVTATATFRSRRENPQTTTALWDCLALIERVKNMPEVDPRSVVLMGGSGGGSLALELAGETELAAIAAGEPATVLFTGLFTKEVVDNRELGNAIMRDPHLYLRPELKDFTRKKIEKIRCPVFIAHGDVHPLKKLNLEIFVPELKAAGKTVELIVYPGQPHGFYFGRNGTPEAAQKFFDDCHAFFKRYLPTQPVPLAQSSEK